MGRSTQQRSDAKDHMRRARRCSCSRCEKLGSACCGCRLSRCNVTTQPPALARWCNRCAATVRLRCQGRLGANQASCLPEQLSAMSIEIGTIAESVGGCLAHRLDCHVCAADATGLSQERRAFIVSGESIPERTFSREANG